MIQVPFPVFRLTQLKITQSFPFPSFRSECNGTMLITRTTFVTFVVKWLLQSRRELSVQLRRIPSGTSCDPDFGAESLNKPYTLNKAELSELVGDLDLPKQKAELLASRLQQWNLLLPGFKITDYGTREKNLFHFFEKKEHVVARIDVNGLMNFMDINYDSNNWWLFLTLSSSV
ncbi:uncharacterized protein TNCV_4914711 [Trichonephila clavipes]|nr:uncharacterized protein TNCV_4914711 [Trichonephila clavipes]